MTEFGSEGLQDGEDFDGEGSSDFTNLNSLDTEEIKHRNKDYVRLYSGTFVANPSVDFDVAYNSIINDADWSAGSRIIVPDSMDLGSTLTFDTERPTITAFGGGMVSLSKTFDGVGLIVDDQNTELWNISVSGQGSGNESAGSHGIEIRQGGSYRISSRSNGGDGVFFNDQTGSNLNDMEAVIRNAGKNGANGVRAENTGGNPNMNGASIEVIEAFNNGSDGVATVSGTNGAFLRVAKANKNGGRGVDSRGGETIVMVAKTENNSTEGVRVGSARSTLIAGVISEGSPTISSSQIEVIDPNHSDFIRGRQDVNDNSGATLIDNFTTTGGQQGLSFFAPNQPDNMDGASMETNQVHMYIDDGGNNLGFKVKDDGGNVLTAEISIS